MVQLNDRQGLEMAGPTRLELATSGGPFGKGQIGAGRLFIAIGKQKEQLGTVQRKECSPRSQILRSFPQVSLPRGYLGKQRLAAGFYPKNGGSVP